MDNTSVFAAVNKMRSLISIVIDSAVHEIWNWAIFKDNWKTAAHIPRILNIEESRTEWMLSKAAFVNIVKGC